MMAEDTAAKEVLKFAKNRLQKFYNPKLYKPPPEGMEAYSKKSEENGGVVEMIDLLIRDLDKEMTEGKTEEKDAQADYEVFMKDSADKRAEDSKTITNKAQAIAELETQLQDKTDQKASSQKDLMATLKYISALHSDCDWLLKYADMRKKARDEEIDALQQAKDVLRGADYSFLQVGAVAQLR